MGANARAILVLHEGDPVGAAVVQLLHEADVPARTPPPDTPADALAEAAFGCRAIIAVGDRFAADVALLGAANMPGVRGLVLAVRGDVDLKPLRTRGIPYTVLRLAPLLEDVVAALARQLERGRVIVDPRDDAAVAAVAIADAAACLVRAVDDDESCGRLVHVAAPERPRLSELAQRIARARGGEARVAAWPRWALVAMRAVGRRPLGLPPELRAAPPVDDLTSLHPGPWRSVEQIAGVPPFHEVAPARRNDDHATMGM